MLSALRTAWGGPRMKRSLLTRLAGIVLAVALSTPAPALALGLDPAFSGHIAGPGQAKGIVIWSHGRSLNGDDWRSPAPPYLRILRDDGWAVMRFDRRGRDDTLGASSRLLAGYASALKHKGYKQVVLAGQSFGAFLALMAADASNDVDAVIATAPAAFGDFEDFYGSWRLNATRLYPLLERVRRARVMVFYFHGDDFDPGGRGERSRKILSRRGLGFAVVDQPAYLTTHWAASTGLFLRRFGSCIREFVDDATLSGELVCSPRWGRVPSAAMKLPPQWTDPHALHAAAGAPAMPAGSGAAPDAGAPPHTLHGIWYGFYPNGREILFGVTAAHGDAVTAIYAIGPSIDDRDPAVWTRRTGRIVGGSFVFKERGKSTLRFRPRDDGGLGATWIAADGRNSMTAHLKPIDRRILARRADVSVGASAPVPPARADGGGDQAKN